MSIDLFEPSKTHCVEIAIRRNRNLRWTPTQDTLRGRWAIAESSGAGRKQAALYEIEKLGDIPGIYIQVCTKTQACRLVDPLQCTPSGRELFRRIELVCKAHPELAGAQVRVMDEALFAYDSPDSEFPNPQMAADTVKTWLYWMRRGVVSKKLVPVAGYVEIPSYSEIAALPGKTDAIPADERNAKDRYRDAVPVNVKANDKNTGNRS
ncbi:hypothetical protein [Kordiimonas sp.]|uniref:hypothetical protein n=1 Tax=Kordiimonas sp. TaxID=1970157 RepID=UPI003A9124AE